MRVFKCGNVHPPDQGANGGRGARAQASAAATSVAKLAAAASAANDGGIIHIALKRYNPLRILWR